MFILCAWYMEVRGQLGVDSFHMVFWVLGCTGLSLTPNSLPKLFLRRTLDNAIDFELCQPPGTLVSIDGP